MPDDGCLQPSAAKRERRVDRRSPRRADHPCLVPEEDYLGQDGQRRHHQQRGRSRSCPMRRIEVCPPATTTLSAAATAIDTIAAGHHPGATLWLSGGFRTAAPALPTGTFGGDSSDARPVVAGASDARLSVSGSMIVSASVRARGRSSGRIDDDGGSSEERRPSGRHNARASAGQLRFDLDH